MQAATQLQLRHWEPFGALWEHVGNLWAPLEAIWGNRWVVCVAFGAILASVRHLWDPPPFFFIILLTESLGIIRSLSVPRSGTDGQAMVRKLQTRDGRQATNRHWTDERQMADRPETDEGQTRGRQVTDELQTTVGWQTDKWQTTDRRETG